MKKHPLDELKERGYVREPKEMAELCDLKALLEASLVKHFNDPKQWLRSPGLLLGKEAAEELGVPVALIDRIHAQEGSMYLGVDPGNDERTCVFLEWRETEPVFNCALTVELVK